MKKLLILALTILSVSCTQAALADNTANIKIKLSGAMHDNRYFLCLPNIGCLSVLAAQKGKIFPVTHSFPMNDIFLTDASDSLKLHPQGLPSSCNVTVKENQTITISGNIVTGANKNVTINHLHCSLTTASK